MIPLLLATLVFAQDTVFEETEKGAETAEAPEAHLGAELGGQYTSGNTEFYLLSAGMNGSYKWKRNKLGTVAGVNIGSSRVDGDGDGLLSEAERDVKMVQTARKAFLDARYDRYLSDKDSLYALAGALHDYYNGFALRTHEQLGYSRTLISTEPTKLLAELGIDWAQEKYRDDLATPAAQNPRQIIAARAMIGLTHAFNENVGLEETLEVYENLQDPEDLRILNNAAIVAKLSDKFSLRFSNALTFDNQPVSVDFRKLDQTTSVTFVASIL
ncbi:MAG: DUF481 domain-containing protein [Proteobacteria bacterium]|nr:DUF481 domain-containing protein [Pseudomonadota bacterium]